MEKLETYVFVGYRLSRRPDHYSDHLFVLARFALLAGQNIVLFAVLQY